MKTGSEKIEISKQVAEIVGRPASQFLSRANYEDKLFNRVHTHTYLVDDHCACAEIAADRRIGTCQREYFESRAIWHDKDFNEHIVEATLTDFHSRIEATSWAICEAVIAQQKESGNG